MVSTFTLNVILSYYHAVPWQLSYTGLLNFGKFEVSVCICSVDYMPNGSQIPETHFFNILRDENA